MLRTLAVSLSFSAWVVFVSAVQADVMPLVEVEGGSFVMGATAGERGERNTLNVTLDSFQIGMHEVTRGLYLSVMGTVPGNHDTDLDLPVTQVSWMDAVHFANALSEHEGLAPVYRISGSRVEADWSADGYRLPTEAEWEFAARGGTQSQGYLFAGGDDLASVGWYRNTSNAPQPVGQLQPNELGIFDMSGNVWEWVWDVYAPYPANAQTNPTGPDAGPRRVSRGGSFAYDPNRARTTNRSAEGRHAPLPYAQDLGFRLARNL